jgi:hypothetical protein
MLDFLYFGARKVAKSGHGHNRIREGGCRCYCYLSSSKHACEKVLEHGAAEKPYSTVQCFYLSVRS